MCMSCGCGKPNDDHGDQRNITMRDIDAAAQAAGTTRDQVTQNIASGMRQDMGQQPSSSAGWSGGSDYGQKDYTQQRGEYGQP